MKKDSSSGTYDFCCRNCIKKYFPSYISFEFVTIDFTIKTNYCSLCGIETKTILLNQTKLIQKTLKKNNIVISFGNGGEITFKDIQNSNKNRYDWEQIKGWIGIYKENVLDNFTQLSKTEIQQENELIGKNSNQIFDKNTVINSPLKQSKSKLSGIIAKRTYGRELTTEQIKNIFGSL